MSGTLLVKTVVAVLGSALFTFAFLFFKNKRKELALVVISIGVGIVVSEFLLRIFLSQVSSHDKMFEYDPWLGWKFIANAKGEITYPGGVRNFVEINAMGFRDHAPSPDKEKKLMVLGDSFVSNISVKDNEVFTEIMEDELSEYDVLNFGVNGYGQVQEYLLAEQWIRNIKPEIIILMLYVQNDFTDNVGAYWSYSRPYASLESKDSVLVIHPQLKNQRSDTRDTLGIFSESHLNILINRGLNNLLGETPAYTPEDFYSCQWPNSEKQESMFRITGKLLVKISNLGMENDVPVVFALAPSIIQVEDDLWRSLTAKERAAKMNCVRTAPNDRLMQFARDNNLLMLDLLPVFLAESKKNVKLYHPVEQHWTKEGNRVVADALLDFLRSTSLLR